MGTISATVRAAGTESTAEETTESAGTTKAASKLDIKALLQSVVAAIASVIWQFFAYFGFLMNS